MGLRDGESGKLAEKIRGCMDCLLWRSRNNAVPGISEI